MRDEGQRKVLLLEDDRLYSLFLRQYLERLGYAVVEAGSLLEFKTLIRAEQPDALISDVGFAEDPGPTARYLTLGGMMALDWMRNQPLLRQPTARIVISAAMTDELRGQFEARQVTAIFEKPFEPDRLAGMLRQSIARQP